MISRNLVAALVGLSLAAGSVGAASAQTAGAPATRQSAPVTAGEPTTPAIASPAKSEKAKVHHTRMHKATHRKHLAHRANSSKAGTKVAQHATKHVRAAKSAGKRVHLARTGKHTTKHV